MYYVYIYIPQRLYLNRLIKSARFLFKYRRRNIGIDYRRTVYGYGFVTGISTVKRRSIDVHSSNNADNEPIRRTKLINDRMWGARIIWPMAVLFGAATPAAVDK